MEEYIIYRSFSFWYRKNGKIFVRASEKKKEEKEILDRSMEDGKIYLSIFFFIFYRKNRETICWSFWKKERRKGNDRWKMEEYIIYRSFSLYFTERIERRFVRASEKKRKKKKKLFLFDTERMERRFLFELLKKRNKKRKIWSIYGRWKNIFIDLFLYILQKESRDDLLELLKEKRKKKRKRSMQDGRICNLPIVSIRKKWRSRKFCSNA